MTSLVCTLALLAAEPAKKPTPATPTAAPSAPAVADTKTAAPVAPASAAAPTSAAAPVVAPAPAAAPAKPVEAPPVLVLKQNTDRVALRATLEPGVPKPGQTFSIDLEVQEAFKKPDPTWGTRRALDDAKLTVVLAEPSAPSAKGKGKAAAWVDAREPLRLRDAGTYGMTFTPPRPGFYTLHVRGTEAGVGAFETSLIVAVGEWPVPAEMKPAPIPGSLPEATQGNLAYGRILCERLCEKNAKGAHPQGQAPLYLDSAMAAAQDDDGLLAALVAPQKVKELSRLDRRELVSYLRSLHLPLARLFPSASVVIAKEFTINQYGRDRLKQSAQLAVGDADATGTVFVVYKAEQAGAGPALVPFSDRVARGKLKKEDKLGYVVFMGQPADKKLREVAFVLGREPTYSITSVVARDESGAREAILEKELKGFVGLGKFNDAKSLDKGPSGLRSKLLPLYLRAAELATMYMQDERDFTAFDDEFK